MSFDKTKAMRNAEKHVAQGKIRAAIAEYRSVVDNDPRDIATMNMLGDLHAKNADKREAIDCYMVVGEHYSTQGFAQKAIAIYNKVSRLQPESIEVLTKLAELYVVKGSIHDAKTQYTTLAEHHEKIGRRIDALSMWKQVSHLDPKNTEVCLKLAEGYLREGQRDECIEAFAEAGARFFRKERYEEAVRCFEKGLDVRPGDLRLLASLVKAYSDLGRTGKAVSMLEGILEDEPYNRDILFLLIDCHVEFLNPEEAEKAVIKLVEIEPANYPRLLDLIQMYLDLKDPDSAARVLSMSSEYLLAAGRGEECNKWIEAILALDPRHVATLRMLVRYASWLKEEDAFRLALERLAEAANISSEVEDERYALAHLVVIRPFEIQYVDRLKAINATYGFNDEVVDEELLRAQFIDDAIVTETVESLENSSVVESAEMASAEVSADAVAFESAPADNPIYPVEIERNGNHVAGIESAQAKLERELESIKFYIENGYVDLAEKALVELQGEFGERAEIIILREQLVSPAIVTSDDDLKSFGIYDIRSEFGLDEADSSDSDDYETHYHTAVAYQEMGLLEQSIGEYQNAINLVSPLDGTRRFFQCANLLGHCFIQNGMANHAVTWFLRALETTNLNVDETQGLWYELALAYEAEGELEKASRYFERVYAENVDFRDVGKRVKNLMVTH